MEFLKTIELWKLIIAGISIGFGLYFARYVKSFLLWIKGGAENGDGVLENKDLQIFMFTSFCGFILVTFAFWDVVWPVYIVTAVFGVTAALYGVKSIGDSYVKSKKGHDSVEPEDSNEDLG